jgi:iron(III) transport system ATP-binding protein
MNRRNPAPVEFRSVTKRYGPVPAVDSLSFTIAPATLVTLLGPSGCGKTTTLRLIAGLELPSEGQILIGGKDVTRMSASERDASMVFQSYALFPHMNVLENVAYGPTVSGVRKRDAEAMASAKLAIVGLSGFERRLPAELSGGQQQRVAVARALVLEPQVLLFDEPLSNLDAKLRRRVREDIRELQQRLNLTVAYVTHDQQEALAVSDHIIVMSNARIAQMGTPRELYEAPRSVFVADFIGDANLIDVEVRPIDDHLAEAHVGGGLVLRLPRRGLGAGQAKIAVRPQSFVLSATSNAAGLEGRIVKSAYLGSHMEYTVSTAGAERFAIDRNVQTPFAAGTMVHVSFADHGVSLVPGTVRDQVPHSVTPDPIRGSA